MKDYDSIDESNKESSNDHSKNKTRSACLSDRVMEGLDEEGDTEGEHEDSTMSYLMCKSHLWKMVHAMNVTNIAMKIVM